MNVHLMPSHSPLVSVIVRSMDRQHLQEALDSLASQNYGNLEVLVVNATGRPHRALGAACGRFPLRMVEPGVPLQRSQAANAGLDAARGDYLMFLDDDDWFGSDHVSSLVAAVTRSTTCLVAYAGVEFRGDNREVLDFAPFNAPYNAGRLHGGNYIPVNAILFSKELLRQGARFDESLLVYEDWDFLLQLSLRTDFLHLDSVSAYYRSSGTSGVGVMADDAAKRAARELIFEKWRHRWSGGQIDDILQQTAALASAPIAALQSSLGQAYSVIEDRDRHVSKMAAVIDSLNASIHGLQVNRDSLNARIQEQDRLIAEQDRLIKERDHWIRERDIRIQAMVGSTSWKVTQPLRSVGLTLKRWKHALRPVHSNRTEPSWTAVASADPSAPVAKPRFLARSSQGRFSLTPEPRGYTYIEPQCPADLAERLRAFDPAISFAIVVPVYNTELKLLDAVLSTVQAQWYPHWTLILANDASTDASTLAALAQINHPKIQVVHLPANQGISGATNAALAVVQSEFVVFMDHDDELTVDCLYELAICIARDQSDFVYSDEDKLTESGDYTQPHFKPKWSPDTMMSTMFTGHVSCVRTSLLQSVGTLRSQFDGCQDWDFVLRVAEHTQKISHVPKVLYHWRIIPASVAADIAAKPYVLDASRRVRMDALERRGLRGSVEPVVQVPGYFRINYHLRGNPKISIIIPSRDNGVVLRCCIESVQSKSSYRNFEIIVLDNGSQDHKTLAYLEDVVAKGQAKVIRHDAPFNFSDLNNIGARHASGELLMFLNDDTEVLTSDWLERMGGYAQLPHIAAVGAKLLYPKTLAVQHAGVVNLADGPRHAFHLLQSDTPGYYMRNLLEYNWFAVTGACLMIEAEKFTKIGGFDTGFPIAYNDIELCIRASKHGFYNVVCQAATLIHHESVSRGLDHENEAKRARLQKELSHLYSMHPDYFQYDPFHSPNLDPYSSNFEVVN